LIEEQAALALARADLWHELPCCTHAAPLQRIRSKLMLRKLATAATCAVLMAATSFAQAADEKKGVRVGTLHCNESSGWGLVFGSTHGLKCTFSGIEKGAKPLRLSGKIKQYGVDIGYQSNAVILWGVIATSERFTPGELAGTYVGATAEVAWAAGLGANVLVGGSKQGFALQPLSVEGLTGANLAAGVTEVVLKPAK
jgi:hypothetical protein